MKKGFTLLEMLVASLLLSMLVMILTMVFSQSSVAWRTGKASVAEMDVTRRRLSYVQRQADDILPGVRPGQTTLGQVVSAWDNSKWKGDNSQLRPRAVEELGQSDLNTGAIKPTTSDQNWQRPSVNFKDKGLGKASAYIVGVRSAGKDGVMGTADDITTWPEDME